MLRENRARMESDFTDGIVFVKSMFEFCWMTFLGIGHSNVITDSAAF